MPRRIITTATSSTAASRMVERRFHFPVCGAGRAFVTDSWSRAPTLDRSDGIGLSVIGINLQEMSWLARTRRFCDGLQLPLFQGLEQGRSERHRKIWEELIGLGRE